METYRCKMCNYVYDPARGDLANGVHSKTPFQDVPDAWVCPVCGAPKEDFETAKQ